MTEKIEIYPKRRIGHFNGVDMEARDKQVSVT